MNAEHWDMESVALAREVFPVGLPVETVSIIEPADGAVTAPLQQCAWNPADRPAYPEGWDGSLEATDRSLPCPLRFSWNPVKHAEPVCYELELRPRLQPHATTGADHERVVLHDLNETCAEVKNLRIGTTYLWNVRARSGRHVLGESGLNQFTTNAAAPRWIHVPGVTNVRDVGGWPLPEGRRVRQGILYRGSELNSHCAITEEGRRVMLDDLGIRTDLDLRGVGETRGPVLDPSKVEYFNIPLASYDMLASPDYTGRYRALFGILAAKRIYPAYLHCWGGADRTGTVAFLLGALLGMRVEDLVTDYELTSLSVWGERRGDSEAFQEMLQTLELFAHKGSSLQAQVERYMKVIGMTDGEIDNLRALFVE